VDGGEATMEALALLDSGDTEEQVILQVTN
jgi:hypothetical protein